MSLKPLVDSLNEHYKAITAYDESDWDFFLNVAEYIKSIKENPALLAIITQLKNKKPDQANLEKYKKQALQELEKIKTILIDRIEKNNNYVENLHDIVIKLKNYTGTNPYELYVTLSEIISALEKENHKDLIRELYVADRSMPQVIFYTLSKAYDLFRNEKERIDNLIETEQEMGFSIVWNELEIIYFLILEKENYFKENILKKPNMLANEAKFLELLDELEKMKNGYSGKIFQKNKYKQYLIRVHSRIIGEMNKKEDFAPEQIKTDYVGKISALTVEKKQKQLRDELKFYSETGDVSYQNELGEVKSGSKGFALLSVFSQSKNTPFNIKDIVEFCNPLVNKPAHIFKSEKDVDDTIRLIKSKLKVSNNAFFPIEKRGSKNDKKWIWFEK